MRQYSFYCGMYKFYMQYSLHRSGELNTFDSLMKEYLTSSINLVVLRCDAGFSLAAKQIFFNSVRFEIVQNQCCFIAIYCLRHTL